MGAVDQQSIGFAVTSKCDSLFTLGFRDAIPCTCTVLFDSEVICAEKSKEYPVVRFDAMNKSIRCCKVTVYLARDIIGDLCSMSESPKPKCARHLHVGYVSMCHTHGSLPVSFYEAVFVFGAPKARRRPCMFFQGSN